MPERDAAREEQPARSRRLGPRTPAGYLLFTGIWRESAQRVLPDLVCLARVVQEGSGHGRTRRTFGEHGPHRVEQGRGVPPGVMTVLIKADPLPGGGIRRFWPRVERRATRDGLAHAGVKTGHRVIAAVGGIDDQQLAWPGGRLRGHLDPGVIIKPPHRHFQPVHLRQRYLAPVLLSGEPDLIRRARGSVLRRPCRPGNLRAQLLRILDIRRDVDVVTGIEQRHQVAVTQLGNLSQGRGHVAIGQLLAGQGLTFAPAQLGDRGADVVIAVTRRNPPQLRA